MVVRFFPPTRTWRQRKIGWSRPRLTLARHSRVIMFKNEKKKCSAKNYKILFCFWRHRFENGSGCVPLSLSLSLGADSSPSNFFFQVWAKPLEKLKFHFFQPFQKCAALELPRNKELEILSWNGSPSMQIASTLYGISCNNTNQSPSLPEITCGNFMSYLVDIIDLEFKLKMEQNPMYITYSVSMNHPYTTKIFYH